jgi:hypothetical protein
MLDPILSFFFLFVVFFFSSLGGGSLVLLFYLNSMEHSKNKQTAKREKKKEKMASQRPWRSAGFDALRRDYKGDNNDDDEYAGAKVSGISVDFTKPPPPTPTNAGVPSTPDQKKRYFDGVRSRTDNETKNTEEFLKLLTEMIKIPIPGASGSRNEPLHLELTMVLNSMTAWVTLKAMMWNFFTSESFKGKLDDIEPSHLKEVVTGILKRKMDRIQAGYQAFNIEAEFVPSASVPGKDIEVPEYREALSPMNTFELKSIIDAINVATANIKNASRLSASTVAMYEPPFYPRLSEDERMMVWNWVNVKQAAVEEIYKDKFYQFATTVAGMVNLNDFGLDKLITSAFKQTPRYHDYKEMPSTIADDPFLSAERDALFGKIVALNGALEQSIVRDGLRMQQRYNNIARDQEAANNDDDETVNHEIGEKQRLFEQVYGAQDNEIPTVGAKVHEMTSEVAKSEETQQLELRVHALEGLRDAYTSENSRQRMLSAVKWMMQPETLKRAEMQPIFSAAIQQALFRVRSMVPSLQNVTDAKMFYESPDGMVVTAFAELVAQQITRTQFFHQTRVMLDKTHSRNQQMENRLKWAMRNFRFDGTHVLSCFSDTSSSSGTCNALYAF